MPWQRIRGAASSRRALPFKYGTIHLITLALALLTLSLLVNFGSQVVQSARLETQRVALATEVTSLESENKRLLGAVEYAESDVNVERVAREQLGMAREGDVVVLPQVQLPTPTPTTATPRALPAPPEDPNWQRWWQALFPPPTR